MAFADNFLAGSIISLLFPTGLLIAIAVWYMIGIKHWPGSDSSEAPQAPVASEPDPPASAP
jgi:hypothetical protein